MADVPLFAVTCPVPGQLIGDGNWATTRSVVSSANGMDIGSTSRNDGSHTGIDPQFRDPTAQTYDETSKSWVTKPAPYSKEKLAGFSVAFKACAFALNDPEAKSTLRDLSARFAAASVAAKSESDDDAQSVAATKK